MSETLAACRLGSIQQLLCIAAQKLVFLGNPTAGLPTESHQVLTLEWGEGFLGKAKGKR